MTQALEYTPTPHRSLGDEAYAIIDKYRHEAGEEFEVHPLEHEFAFFMHRIGATGLYLADATNNPARTFKWRGAFNKMHQLKEDGEETVIVPSAGNHLRGAALAAKVLGMKVYGAVPANAPKEKKEGARALRGNSGMFTLHAEGASFDESLAWAKANGELGTLVHPYDDPLVAAGQGTIADDMMRAFDDAGMRLDHVVVPVGGGGLLSGLAERFYQLDPHVTVHGFEATGSDSLSRSSAAHKVTEATSPNARYGGSAVRRTGKHTLASYESLPNIQLGQVDDEDVELLVDEYLQEIDHRDLRRGMTDFVPLEPTTLVAVAGLERVVQAHPGETIAVVGTGRNEEPEAFWR